MPRTPDPDLPKRILKAADALWQAGGEEAVTIRGVAAKATTTTPTVYSYYKDRETLLAALRALVYRRFIDFLAEARSIEQTCARHMEFGERYPRDYELLYGRGWMARAASQVQEAEIEAFAAQLVKAGVDRSRATTAAYPILMLLHGVVMHRLLNDRNPSANRHAIHAACLDACGLLIENARNKAG